MIVIIAILIAGIETVMLANAASTSRKNLQRELDSTVTLACQNIRLFCEEVEDNVDSLYSSPKLQAYFTEDDPEERYVISQFIQDIINATIYGNSNISSIRILQNRYRVTVAGSSTQNSIFHRANYDYGLFDRMPDEDFYTRVYLDETTGKPYAAYVRPVYPVKCTASQREESQKKLFYVLCRLDSLQNYLNALIPTGSEMTVAVEGEGGVILSTDPGLLGEQRLEDEVFSDRYQMSSLSYEKTGWKVWAAAPIQSAYRSILSTLKENLAIALISLAVIAEIGIWITRNLTNPITKLSNDIHALPSSGRLPEDYGLPEIRRTARYINGMLGRIQDANAGLLEAQNRLHQASIAKKEAELAFFQTQINPHFLYNTLECMRSIGQAYQAPEIQILASSMAKIFRYSIKARDSVLVSEELTCTADYFEIINIRFPGRYHLEVDVPTGFRGARMPKMILQPLVENAIGHGLDGRSDGTVRISARREENGLCILVEDNGAGIEPGRLEEINRYLHAQTFRKAGASRRNSVALDNINRRLQLDSGGEYGLALESEPGKGTRVTIRIPLLS